MSESSSRRRFTDTRPRASGEGDHTLTEKPDVALRTFLFNYSGNQAFALWLAIISFVGGVANTCVRLVGRLDWASGLSTLTVPLQNRGQRTLCHRWKPSTDTENVCI